MADRPPDFLGLRSSTSSCFKQVQTTLHLAQTIYTNPQTPRTARWTPWVAHRSISRSSRTPKSRTSRPLSCRSRKRLASSSVRASKATVPIFTSLDCSGTSLPPILSPDNELTVFVAIHSLTDTCFKKCITGTFRQGKLDRSEEPCMQNCVDRFLDANMTVLKHLDELRTAM